MTHDPLWKQLKRISDMEHDLGMVPCSLPKCFSCAYGSVMRPERITK